MPKVLDILKANAAYEFVVVGVVWLAVAYLDRSILILWPVVTCVTAGLLLKFRPAGRLTWAWTTSSAALGLLLSGYQAYVAAPLLAGTFSSIAAISFTGFTVFAIIHLFLLYAGYSPAGQQAK